jgi:hypothetical protein
LTTQTRLTNVQKSNCFPERFVQAAVPYDNQQRQTGLSRALKRQQEDTTVSGMR